MSWRKYHSNYLNQIIKIKNFKSAWSLEDLSWSLLKNLYHRCWANLRLKAGLLPWKQMWPLRHMMCPLRAVVASISILFVYPCLFCQHLDRVVSMFFSTLTTNVTAVKQQIVITDFGKTACLNSQNKCRKHKSFVWRESIRQTILSSIDLKENCRK